MNRVGANIPPGVPLVNDNVVARIFSPARIRSRLQPILAVHGLIHVLITGAHHLRKPAYPISPMIKPGQCWLEILCPARQRFELGARSHSTDVAKTNDAQFLPPRRARHTPDSSSVLIKDTFGIRNMRL